MSKFKPEISIESYENELIFNISGSQNYGLDKSIINGLRRILLTEIPTVAFKTDESMNKKDIEIISNTSALHNEMLLQRMSLIPLYINPDKYMKNYLFELKIIHKNSNPLQFVTTNDINIYPLLSEIQNRIDNLDDNEDDFEELNSLLNTISINNYDMNNPIDQKQKDKILKPFEFRNQKNYILISELKNTNSEDFKQEINLYGSPSVSIGKENARFQPVSCATYSFLIDDELVESVFQERILVQNITDETEIESFKKKFILSESEKYYYRDYENEPYKYQFKIKSCHFSKPHELFIKSIDILLNKSKNFKLSLIEMLKKEDTSISSLKINEFVYHYTINDEGHTLGNIIQSFITRRSIDDKSMIQICGYKKPHPLEESFKLYISLNPNHKIMKETERNRFQSLTSFLTEQIDKIHNELKILKDVSEESF